MLIHNDNIYICSSQTADAEHWKQDLMIVSKLQNNISFKQDTEMLMVLNTQKKFC